MTQPDKINLILTKGAEYFGIPKDEIGIMNPQGKKGTGRYSQSKKFIAYVLKENTTLTNEQIAYRLGYRTQSIMGHLHRTVEDELSGTAYGQDKTKRIYNELLAYINLPQ